MTSLDVVSSHHAPAAFAQPDSSVCRAGRASAGAVGARDGGARPAAVRRCLTAGGVAGCGQAVQRGDRSLAGRPATVSYVSRSPEPLDAATPSGVAEALSDRTFCSTRRVRASTLATALAARTVGLAGSPPPAAPNQGGHPKLAPQPPAGQSRESCRDGVAVLCSGYAGSGFSCTHRCSAHGRQDELVRKHSGCGGGSPGQPCDIDREGASSWQGSCPHSTRPPPHLLLHPPQSHLRQRNIACHRRRRPAAQASWGLSAGCCGWRRRRSYRDAVWPP